MRGSPISRALCQVQHYSISAVLPKSDGTARITRTVVLPADLAVTGVAARSCQCWGQLPQSSLHLCRVQVNGGRELPRPAEPHPPDLALRCLSGASLGRRSPWPHSVSSSFSVPHSSNLCVLFSVSVYDVGWGQQQTLREKKGIYGSLLVQRRKAGDILHTRVSCGHCEDSKMMSSLLLRTLSITSAGEI